MPGSDFNTRWTSSSFMVFYVHRNHDGRVKVAEEREIIYPSLYCHNQNDSCLKMGRDESHFKVSLIVRDKVTA